MRSPRQDRASERIDALLALWQPDTRLTEGQSRRLSQRILDRALAPTTPTVPTAPTPAPRGLLALLTALTPLLIVALVAGIVLAGRFMVRPAARPATLVAASREAPPRPHQVQFLAPHGTRIVWLFNPAVAADRSAQAGPREIL
jgi:hypothetical protein